MGKINTVIDDDIEMAFRKAANEVFGYKRGAFQKALERAILTWLESLGNPVNNPANSSGRPIKNVMIDGR